MRYIDMLPDLVYSYNHTIHHSIKKKPADVSVDNEKQVWHTLYDDRDEVKHVKYKFNIGDQVRISKIKRTFEKGYLPNFSKEIFTVSKQIPRDPPVYKLKDYDGEELKGTFYENELQKVIKPDDVYEVEKILKKRGRGRNVQYLVKWLGYPNKFNTLQFQQNHIYYSLDGGKSFWSSAIIDYGYYTSIPELIKSINAAMKKELKNNNITFSFNPRTHKVKVTLATKHCVGLYGQLAKILGFGGGGDLKILKSKESPYVAELQSITSIYVYCNIVQPQIVGNTMVLLLRTTPVGGNSGDVIAKTFTNIQYVPVQTKSFEDIEILLRTDTGDPVPFECGKVIATLYFRKQSYFD